MTNHTSRIEPQHPPLARDALGNLLAVPDGTCAWRASRETSGRPREIRGTDKQPIRFPLDTTSDELVELCGSGVYRIYALDEVGAQLADEHVAKWDLTPGSRELRNGALDTPMLSSLRASPSSGAATDLRFALEAMTQMMRTNSEALRAVTDAHVDLAKSLATAKGIHRNAPFMLTPAANDEDDEEDDDVEEQPRRVVDLLMPFAEKLAEMVPGVVMGTAMKASKAISTGEPAAKPENGLAARPQWEPRDLIDLNYASRKAEAKRVAKDGQADRASAIAALQARLMADPALVQHLLAIKERLDAEEIETLMSAVGSASDAEQTKFIDSVKALPVEGAVAFCRDVVAAVRAQRADSTRTS